MGCCAVEIEIRESLGKLSSFKRRQARATTKRNASLSSRREVAIWRWKERLCLTNIGS